MPFSDAQGAPMKVQQISIFLENKAGRLAEVTNLLAEAGVNIKALSLADTSEFGILRLIVDNQEKAQSVLKNNGVTVRLTDVVAAEVSHTPGGLNSILQLLQGRGINVEYMYGLPYQHANASWSSGWTGRSSPLKCSSKAVSASSPATRFALCNQNRRPEGYGGSKPCFPHGSDCRLYALLPLIYRSVEKKHSPGGSR